MCVKSGFKETRKISESEQQMRKGADSVFYSDGSFVSVFEAILPEIEQFIGKEETERMLLEAIATDRFSIFSDSQLEYVAVLVERLCRSLEILNSAQRRWDILLGRIYSELKVYYDLTTDEDDD